LSPYVVGHTFVIGAAYVGVHCIADWVVEQPERTEAVGGVLVPGSKRLTLDDAHWPELLLLLAEGGAVPPPTA
jgi:hypothetical protein